MINKETQIRIVGIISSILLISFIFQAVFYWANFPLQEIEGNMGGLMFWTGLILLLLFKVNAWLIYTTDMIFYPWRFVEGRYSRK